MKNIDLVKALTDIAEENAGVLSPESVVAAATAPGSVLHDYFDWDDSSAGEKWRLTQASSLIRRVKIEVVRPHAETKEVAMVTTRAFASLGPRHYEPVEIVLSSADKRQMLVNQALAELEAFQRKYQSLDLLAGVFKSIEELKRKTVKGKRKGGRKELCAV